MRKYRINPGDFRHIIIFQKAKGNKNEYGEGNKESIGWKNYLTTRAAIYPVSAREFFSAEMKNSEVSHKVFMRYIPQVEITTDMRIQFGSRIFELIGPPINFEEKNNQLLLMCKEVV